MWTEKLNTFSPFRTRAASACTTLSWASSFSLSSSSFSSGYQRRKKRRKRARFDCPRIVKKKTWNSSPNTSILLFHCLPHTPTTIYIYVASIIQRFSVCDIPFVLTAESELCKNVKSGAMIILLHRSSPLKYNKKNTRLLYFKALSSRARQESKIRDLMCSTPKWEWSGKYITVVDILLRKWFLFYSACVFFLLRSVLYTDWKGKVQYTSWNYVYKNWTLSVH